MTRYVFTAANAHYGPKVAALAESLKRHEPDVRFVWALVERQTIDVTTSPAVDEVLQLDHLDRDWVTHLTGRPVVEACTAVKGAVLRHLLDREGCESVTYLDPDIYVYGSLDPVWRGLAASAIVLKPCLLSPSATAEGIRDNEISALKHGIYNLGFIAVASSQVGKSFAEWWDVRLWDYCLAAPEQGLFTDQRWIDHVPVFFPDVHILRHEGCNVASWNLGEREVYEQDGRLKVGSVELIFWHFSAVDHQAHLDMTNKYARSELPRRISAQYRSALHGYSERYGGTRGWSLAAPLTVRARVGTQVRNVLVSAAVAIARSPLGPAVRLLVPKQARSALRSRIFNDAS